MKKLMLLVAGGIGYVLGARAGRERYDQIERTFRKVKNDPRVQEKSQQAADFAKEQAPVVKEKAASAAGTASTRVKQGAASSSDTSGDVADQLNPDSLHFQEGTGPQGDLP